MQLMCVFTATTATTATPKRCSVAVRCVFSGLYVTLHSILYRIKKYISSNATDVRFYCNNCNNCNAQSVAVLQCVAIFSGLRDVT